MELSVQSVHFRVAKNLSPPVWPKNLSSGQKPEYFKGGVAYIYISLRALRLLLDSAPHQDAFFTRITHPYFNVLRQVSGDARSSNLQAHFGSHCSVRIMVWISIPPAEVAGVVLK